MAGTPEKLAARRVPLQLNEYDLRYLRKAVRYRLGSRNSNPGMTDGRVAIGPQRAQWLDELGDWILADNPHPPMPVNRHREIS